MFQDKKRVLTLVYDLLTERDHIIGTEDSVKAEQYANAPFRNALVDAGVCNLLPTALSQLPGLDGQQKVSGSGTELVKSIEEIV